jgi:hypothetical protein
MGFRRWHERQLIEAHASLVTAFLALIAVAVGSDQFQWRDSGFPPLLTLALIVAGIVLCYKAVMFYLRVLARAEHFAAQAVCSECQTYGRIEVLAAVGHATQAVAGTVAGDQFDVRCRKCGHGWTMTSAQPGPS